jgi:phage terminase small subunit
MNPLTTPPDTLCPEAKAKYSELAPKLAERCKDTPTDLLRDLIAQYADAWAMRERAMKELREAPSLLVMSTNKSIYARPELKIVEQCEKCMDRCFRRMGFGGKRAEDEDVDNVLIVAQIGGRPPGR